MLEPITYVINSSFTQGCFPNALKKSIVTPLYKTGDRTNVSNYRPIAQLSVFSKIFEKAFCERIIKYVEKYKILNDRQHGFIQGKSTQTALVGYINEVMEALENKKSIMGIYYDYSKCFDSVNKEILLHKLGLLGISGVANNWIRSYLTNRTQIVRLTHNGQKYLSDEAILNIGLPQGANLSPLLFILFTNDLPSFVKVGKLTLYADDTTHLVTSDTNDLCNYANRAVNELESWSNDNGLFINRDKTVMMRFLASKEDKQLTPLVRLEGKYLKEVMDTKFLGVKIDNKLDWKLHIKYIRNKLAPRAYLIKRMMNVVSFDLVKQIYFAYFQSILMYGTLLWGGSPHVKSLFILQKRTIRFMARANSNPCSSVYIKDSCKPLFIRFSILNLPCIYIHALIMYTVQNRNLTQSNDMIHGHNTRGKEDIRVANCKRITPLRLGCKLFNVLPNNFKKMDKNTLSCKLKEFLLKKCFYSIDEFLDDLMYSK